LPCAAAMVIVSGLQRIDELVQRFVRQALGPLQHGADGYRKCSYRRVGEGLGRHLALRPTACHGPIRQGRETGNRKFRQGISAGCSSHLPGRRCGRNSADAMRSGISATISNRVQQGQETPFFIRYWLRHPFVAFVPVHAAERGHSGGQGLAHKLLFRTRT
jgi:hypothetical protein